MNRAMNRVYFLNAYIEAAKSKPFQPGRHDCALFAAAWVKMLTGRDLATEFRGQYRTLKDGKAQLQAHGYRDHIALAAATFGEVPLSSAVTGDLAVIGDDALGIVSGENVFALRPHGVAVCQLTDATRIFRV